MLFHPSGGQGQAVAGVRPEGAEQPLDTALPPRAVQARRQASAVDPSEAAWWRPGYQPGLQDALEDHVGLFVALHLVRGQVLQDVGCRQAVAAGRAVRGAAGAAQRTAATHHVVPLVGRLDRDDEVVAVGDHHVRDLVQCLPGHLNPVHLQDLIVHGQQPSALGQAARHHTGDEDAGHLLQPLWGHAHARAVADVEAQWLLAAMPVQPHTAVCLGEDVHVDDGGHGAEVMGQANVQVCAPARAVLPQGQGAPPPGQ